jgi:GGDEF domain-containing protein
LSIGGVSTCGFQGHPSALLASADEALYRAKRDGRNCVATTRLP